MGRNPKTKDNMEENKVIAEVNYTGKQELTEEEKRKQKEQEIKEQNQKTREDAKKARRPSPARMAEEIRLMAKRAADPYEPTEAKYARALIGIFLRELAAHKQGKHVEVTNRILADMKEKRPIQIRQDNALALANAAIRYDIAFGRVAMR